MRFRSVLIVNDLIRTGTIASIPVGYFLGVLSIWQLYLSRSSTE
jgi:hypothetical protein